MSAKSPFRNELSSERGENRDRVDTIGHWILDPLFSGRKPRKMGLFLGPRAILGRVWTSRLCNGTGRLTCNPPVNSCGTGDAMKYHRIPSH